MRYSLIFFLLLFFLISCNSAQKEYSDLKPVENSEFADGFVGDQNCKECHQEAYDLWRGSHHDLAMQIATDETVLGNFDDQRVVLDGVNYHFFKKDGKFYVDVQEIDGSENQYKIGYTFGITPLQQYMTDFDKGRKQVLRATWDTEKNVWFHQYKDQQIDPGNWLHWSRGGQNWNTMCAECHSTNLKKNYNIVKDSFNTTYSVINVSCESCHGPGEKHLEWAKTEDKNKDMAVFTGINQKDQINQCGPCHSRRVKLTENFEPGLEFDDQFMVQTLTPEFYFGDGQILEEDYVLASFMQSKMFMNAIKCSDCHNAHSMNLKFEGNKLCLQCHIPAQYDSKEHHFHDPLSEAGKCVNCHMTGRYYMGNDFRRDHSFRVPRPDQSLEYGTPNACEACHQEKGNKWSADWIKKWYGKDRKDHFSDHMLLSTKGNFTSDERNKVHAFILDVKYPFITRATALENLNLQTQEDYATVIQSLKDSSALIRFKANQKLMDIGVEERSSVGLQLMYDEKFLTRLGAAQLLLGFDENQLDETQKAQFRKVRKEYEKFLYANADFATGNLNLGDYFMQINDMPNAIKSYQKSLEMDSLLFPVYTNLATAYSISNQNEKSLSTLDELIKRYPENGRGYYLRALVQNELGNLEKAIEDFEQAIKLESQDSRSRYNLSTLYYQNKQFSLAEKYAQEAINIEPENGDFQYLLAMIYRDQGKRAQADAIMKKLQARQNRSN